ncbi:transposase, partial [Escherichia coli]|nr:transposase [Escherichia coli]
MSGKRYPEEFKTEAVKQVVDRGYSVASVATRLDITTHSRKRLARTVLIFTERSDQLSRATDRVP